MPVLRFFLGWDAPATVKVREFLLPPELSGPVELARDLIVVPTQQAESHFYADVSVTPNRKTEVRADIKTQRFLLKANPWNLGRRADSRDVAANGLLKPDYPLPF